MLAGRINVSEAQRVGYVETIVPTLEDAIEEAQKVVSEVLTTGPSAVT